MKTKLVKVGNSQGIRIPKALIEAAGIESDLDMELEAGAIVLRRPRKARAGWEEAFRQLGPDETAIDDVPATEWDDAEWEWE
jgi:antitoxin MazE